MPLRDGTAYQPDEDKEERNVMEGRRVVERSNDEGGLPPLLQHLQQPPVPQQGEVLPPAPVPVVLPMQGARPRTDVAGSTGADASGGEAAVEKKVKEGSNPPPPEPTPQEVAKQLEEIQALANAMDRVDVHRDGVLD